MSNENHRIDGKQMPDSHDDKINDLLVVIFLVRGAMLIAFAFCVWFLARLLL